MPYDWFLWLEQKSSTELFRSAQNIEKYKYIPQKATPLNPDGLPIGFANNDKKDAWVGLTCSACHTGQVNYGKTAMVIDGAPTMADFQTFFIDLEKAMNHTLNTDVKFERFAINVLGENYNESSANELRSKFLEMSKSEGVSKFDTTLYNNSNAGHEYGVNLSEEQKWELMEFLKTL